MTERERKEKLVIHEYAVQLKCKIEDFDSYCDFLRDQFEKEEDERIKAKINEILNEVTKHINMLKEVSDKFFEDSKLV